MTSCILDASVAAKWFLPASKEPLSAEAREVLEEYASGHLKITVPDLFWPEIGNILWKAIRYGRITQAAAEEAMATLENCRLVTVPSSTLWKEAFAIAVAWERTVYDSIYVALAAVTGVPLLTADERLANALASRFPVRWLGSFHLLI